MLHSQDRKPPINPGVFCFLGSRSRDLRSNAPKFALRWCRSAQIWGHSGIAANLRHPVGKGERPTRGVGLTFMLAAWVG